MVEADTAPDEEEALEEGSQEIDASCTTIEARLHRDCQALLAHIIEQWASLETLKDYQEYQEGMTKAQFQDYFLRRHGVLRRISVSPEEYYWHLTLPIMSYDTPALAPPWSVQQIRLPWMSADLVVFWMPH